MLLLFRHSPYEQVNYSSGGSCSSVASHLLTMRDLEAASIVSFDIEEVDERYDLQAMFTRYQFDPVKAEAEFGSFVQGETMPERPVMLFLMHLLNINNPKLYAKVRSEAICSVGTSPGFKRLVPFLSKLNMKSDGCIQLVIGQEKVAILLIEKHSKNESSSYSNTWCKTVSNVIDMFRNLRLYNPDLEKAVGFTLPKINYLEAVSKVVVSFEADPLQFRVEACELNIDNVCVELLSATSEALKYFDKQKFLSPDSYFLRLSNNDINVVASAIGENSLDQVRSAHSIILCNKEYYFKYYPSNLLPTFNMYKKCSPCQHVVDADISYFNWLKFSALLSPLNIAEAVLCLADFFRLLQTALTALHNDCGLAHLDVRLPNVCFKYKEQELIAVLIDLDRAKPASSKGALPYDDEMYTRPSSWTLGQLDWKQVGLLGKKVHCGNDFNFLKSLIKFGTVEPLNIGHTWDTRLCPL